MSIYSDSDSGSDYSDSDSPQTINNEDTISDSDDALSELSNSDDEYNNDQVIFTKAPVVVDQKDLKNIYSYAQYKIFSENDKKKFTMCDCCTNYCQKEVLTTQKYMGMTVCYHCLFFINYSADQRSLVDGQYGLTISDYVLKFAKDHEPCNRTCFICDYKNDITIDNIKNGDILFSNNNKKITGNVHNNKILIII